MQTKYYPRHVPEGAPAGWVRVMHEVNIPFDRIQKMLAEFSPDLIVELGTKYGGMTVMFHDACPEALLYSYDHRDYGDELNNESIHGRDACADNVHFMIEDVLNVNQNIVNLLVNYTGKVFLYCDNGNKVEEVHAYAPFLKSGDMLGFHDCPDEITPEQVADVLKDYDEHPINEWLVANHYSDRFYVRVVK